MEVWDFAPPQDDEEDEEKQHGSQEESHELEMVDATEDLGGKDTVMDAYRAGETDSDDMTD